MGVITAKIKGLITWRISARVEILASAPKYEIAREDSQENQNGAKNTNRENRRIASLAVWPSSFGGAQFSPFGMVTPYKMMELNRNLSLAARLSARKTYLQRKRRYLQARRVYGFPDSLELFNLICIEVDILTLYLSFEIRETMNKILYFIALIPLKSLLLPSGSHIVSCFSARLKFPFRLREISVFRFSGPLARLSKPG